MKYRFIDEQRGCYRVEKMARTLGVSRAGYYEWRRHGETTKRSRDRALVERITEIQEKVKYRYGSPRITKEAREGRRSRRA